VTGRRPGGSPVWQVASLSRTIPRVSNLISLIDQLATLAVAPLLLGLLASAALLSVTRNWRLALPVLLLQYVLAGILLARVIDPGVAIIKPIAGVIVCLALSVAAQRADSARAARAEEITVDRVALRQLGRLPAQFAVRVLGTVLALTAAIGMSSRFPLPGEARELAVSAYVLIATAAFVIATSTHTVNTGIGILTLMTGIELAYTPLEPSISVSVLLGLTTLLVGIAVAYLTLADGGGLAADAGDIPEDTTSPDASQSPPAAEPPLDVVPVTETSRPSLV
jgi:hypothetical protein